MLATGRELGTTLWIADALGNLGEDLMTAGEAEAAATYLDEALRLAGEGIKFVMRPTLARAEILLRTGSAVQSLEVARHAGRIAPGMRVFVADALRIEGEALAALGRAGEAEPVLRAAKALAVELSATPIRWRTGLALARLLAANGHRSEAKAEATEALTAIESVAAALPDAGLRGLFEASGPLRDIRAFL
jgi:tetratricopeptide (TPR) repeat protein